MMPFAMTIYLINFPIDQSVIQSELKPKQCGLYNSPVKTDPPASQNISMALILFNVGN